MLRMFIYSAGFLLGFFFDHVNEAVGTYWASIVVLLGLVVAMAWDMANEG